MFLVFQHRRKKEQISPTTDQAVVDAELFNLEYLVIKISVQLSEIFFKKRFWVTLQQAN